MKKSFLPVCLCNFTKFITQIYTLGAGTGPQKAVGIKANMKLYESNCISQQNIKASGFYLKKHKHTLDFFLGFNL